MVNGLDQLSLRAVYPPALPEINLNTCADPDCGNYGVIPDFARPVFKGPNAAERKLRASAADPALSVGRGHYTMTTDDKRERISDVFEYDGDPRVWSDGREIECHHQRGNGECGISFGVLSNKHFLDELDRLRTQNGALEGPVCKNCGRRYLDHPEEFVFNGTHGVLPAERNRRKEKPSGFRIIHKPCKGKAGARISATLDHQAQKKQNDNVRLLRALVNGASINDLRRLLSDPDTGKKCGVSRIYSRIFWLEKALLAFERAKLKEWKAREEASERFSHTRIAHDDVVISVNWESKSDQRLTPIYCSVSADIRSGYVFRIDANFDPRIDPVGFVEKHYLDESGKPANLNRTYSQKSGKTFTAPLMRFQRPSGRYDEASLFASAEGSWRVFAEKLERAYEDELALGMQLPSEVQSLREKACDRRLTIDEIRNRYFGFPDTNKDFRGSFQGIMVGPTYTKAAHFGALREMLPKGKITLVGEMESQTARVIPHLFRDLIHDDLFEWMIIKFDKKASTPVSNKRKKDFQEDLDKFAAALLSSGEELARYEILQRYCSINLRSNYVLDRFNTPHPIQISNFQSIQFPQVWIKSPVQQFGETEKSVGFPLLRKEYRRKLKGQAFDQEVTDQELRDALARRVLKATIQPVSSFMNSLRMRTSHTQRAGGKSARTGPSYINGAVFNPAVLVAVLNIYRVWFNWFESRQYVGPGAEASSEAEVEEGLSHIRIPGSGETMKIPKRRAAAPLMRTPAMRLGADAPRNQAPDPRRILYRPWLFHGTPLWRKFETR